MTARSYKYRLHTLFILTRLSHFLRKNVGDVFGAPAKQQPPSQSPKSLYLKIQLLRFVQSTQDLIP